MTTPAPIQRTHPSGATIDQRDWIAGLEHGLVIMEAFDDQNPRMTASQVGVRCGLTRTAARRHLLTLVYMGYAATDGKLFWLTPRVLRMAQNYLESARLPRLVQPFLQRVTAGTHEIAYFSVMDGDEVVYIARNGANRTMNTGIVLGSRVQAQVTAAGLMMLALRAPEQIAHWLAHHTLKAYTSHSELDKAALATRLRTIRQQGWALSEQQLELGYRGVAVPLIDRHGNLVGAINVTMPMGQEPGTAAVQRVLPVLQETARAMRVLL